MKKRLVFILLFCFVCCIVVAQEWQSDLVKIGKKNNLIYLPDKDGFIIPDFSHAGYKGGGVDIPKVKIVKEISPVAGDNTLHIQSAIDEIAALSLNKNGLRGALLLKEGIYPVSGTIFINSSGIVLKGEIDSNNSLLSTIKGIGNVPDKRDLVIIGNTSLQNWEENKIGTNTYITTPIVPVGAYSFEVEDASTYKKGDAIVIYHPCTQKWLEAIDFGGTANDPGWTPGEQPIEYQRYITKISGNTITIDAPVFYTLNKELAPCYIYKTDVSVFCNNCGVEDLKVEIETKGGKDEEHASNCVLFYGAENCWAKNVTAKGFILSGFITHLCTRSTIQNCISIEPVGIQTGGRFYNFNTYERSQLVLFEDCYAKGGRHNYISNGNSTASGCVFYNCTSEATTAVNEGHRRWSTGILFDNHKEIGRVNRLVIALYNRGDWGTGHGWAMAHGVLWNCDATEEGEFCIQKPPTGQNYSIGGRAKTAYGKHRFTHPEGYIEGLNQHNLLPQSLYKAQLKARGIK